ncbi:hypothetical protein [Spirilliplanes yamanashiensis]|uniref:Uncharacterized protein n=1 Tax=Spirilliplanes yamanashiensis TaxID=42233 RepID=A0A8J3YB79_9ACTN|nr:hypothetical protein [Spirilliplanes yamanashiensis]MDP9817812.1 hypothetical protein [Spirilliplanes yamanashiensis]GIJ04622.1 hypothetical protein Sya03_39740 [Spirilliplanes yamanashiensis]
MVDATVAGQALHAVWIGELPRVGESVDVELDVPGPHAWGDTVTLDVPGGELPGGPWLHGVVELQDHEGLVTLRIADGLVAVDVEGSWPSLTPGTKVAVLAQRVLLYPTGI